MKTHEELANPTLLLKRVLYWRMAFFSVIILLAGIGIGASGASMWFLRQKPKPTLPQPVTINRVMRRLNYQLNLTKPQADQVRPMLRKCVVALEQVRRKARPEINQHLLSMNRGIASVLDDTQSVQWKKYEKQLMGLLQENRVQIQVPGKSKPQIPKSGQKPSPEPKPTQ